MSDEPLDVRFLEREDLPRDAFPGAPGEVFRVHFTPEVHAEIARHAAENTAVEICGVLVGDWRRDEVGPFVRITASIPGEAAQNKFAEVTFTHETWARINARMDAQFAALRIVGWYHTHPDFGVFLSDRDRFIQEHFFSGPGQVAHVVDPIRRTEGVFVWRDGTPTLTGHFWVGDKVMSGTAADAESRPRSEGSTSPAAPAPAPERPSGGSGFGLGRLLIYLAVLVLGYGIAEARSTWQRQLLAEGAATRFGIWKGLRPGLRAELDAVARDLALISRATEVLEADSGKSKARVTWDELRAGLDSVSRRVQGLKKTYGYTETEEEAVRRLVIEVLAREGIDRPQDAKAADPTPREKVETPSKKPEEKK